MSRLPTPVNVNETYLHAIVKRLDTLNAIVAELSNKLNTDSVQIVENEPGIEEINDTQCIATTRAGNRCKGTRMDKLEYCNIHAPKE